MNKFIYILLPLQLITFHAAGQDSISLTKDTLKFKGQFSSWAHYNPENPYPFYVGGRYIPQVNYEIQFPKARMLDFELSVNIYGSAGIHFFDSASVDGNINPYRGWGRYSSEQFELRLGLQKIDFGTAVMLRSLRWFDQVDPRDPLRLTEGVWAGLARYYFLNNVNIWVWALYGNKNLKGTELIKTNFNFPEFGGRLQFLVPKGEAGLSYHNRIADSRDMDALVPAFTEIKENRIGLDAKWDLVVGLWLEASWVNKNQNLGMFTNQEAFTLGADYTFGIGSGLNVTFEHMLLAYNEKAFEFSQTTNFSGLSLNYPIGMFDNINAIIYYDWTKNHVYNFVNWFRQFDKTTFYVMAYWNPKNDEALAIGPGENLYGGLGAQLMFVFNH